MRVYHLFVIREKYYNNYEDNPDILYNAFKTFINTSINSYSLAFSIHNQLCEEINIELLSDYFNDRFNIKDNKIKYLIENRNLNELSIVILKKSCIKVYTTSNMPHFMRIFKIYNKRMFVVDFQNEDYFWLNDYYKFIGKF